MSTLSLNLPRPCFLLCKSCLRVSDESTDPFDNIWDDHLSSRRSWPGKKVKMIGDFLSMFHWNLSFPAQTVIMARSVSFLCKLLSLHAVLAAWPSDYGKTSCWGIANPCIIFQAIGQLWVKTCRLSRTTIACFNLLRTYLWFWQILALLARIARSLRQSLHSLQCLMSQPSHQPPHTISLRPASQQATKSNRL